MIANHFTRMPGHVHFDLVSWLKAVQDASKAVEEPQSRFFEWRMSGHFAMYL